MPFSLRKQTIRSQDTALRALAELVRDGIESPHVRATALKIVRDCGSRDDQCELQKIFDAVKHGDSSVKALEQGFPYRADPKTIDWFSGADRLLKMCEAGACGGDCDEHTVMLASLAGSLGFTVGLRAYGKPEERGFSHIYAVAITPKKAGLGDLKRSLQGFGGANLSGLTFGESVETVGMDTTVPSSYLGWQPPKGHYKTAWVTDE